MRTRRVRHALAGLAAVVAAAVLVPSADAASVGPFSMEARQVGGSYVGGAVCSTGDGATDGTVDRLVADPTAGAFLTVELRQTASLGAAVHTRTKIKFQPGPGVGEDDWYQLVHHGTGGARLLSTVEQVMSFDLGGSAPVGSMPSIGEPVTWTIHSDFSQGKIGNKTHSCEIAVKVYAEGDPAASGATPLADIAHAPPHAHHPLSGLGEQLRLFVYPAGPSFAVACNGTTPLSTTTQGDKGEFRIEADADGRTYSTLTSDAWAFTDVGNGLSFNWRQRSPDLPRSRAEQTQAGQRWTVRLPDGSALHEHQPVTWHFQAHWHLVAEPSDPNGAICQGAVRVSASA